LRAKVFWFHNKSLEVTYYYNIFVKSVFIPSVNEMAQKCAFKPVQISRIRVKLLKKWRISDEMGRGNLLRIGLRDNETFSEAVDLTPRVIQFRKI